MGGAKSVVISISKTAMEKLDEVANTQTLIERFMQKLPTLLFVSTFAGERDGVEYFHYYSYIKSKFVLLKEYLF
jgi:hypothetical protein